MITSMLALWELILLMLSNLFSRLAGAKLLPPPPQPSTAVAGCDASYCLSWRVAVETNNARGWRTVPTRCVLYVESYMLGGQYDRDVETAVECIVGYADGLVVGDDGMDAWVLDVDDTCLSNLLYYQGKQFGHKTHWLTSMYKKPTMEVGHNVSARLLIIVDRVNRGAPFDPTAFKSWAQRGICPAIPQVLILYQKLLERGYKVFLLTGRDQETLGATTTSNLILQGFIGHERLFMRNRTYRGQSAVAFKSTIRKQLVAEGYRIRGNVGDQWSDLQGDCIGDRIFKIPNPMYFVP